MVSFSSKRRGRGYTSSPFKLSKYIIEVNLADNRRRILSTKSLSVVEYKLNPRFTSIQEWLNSCNFTEKEQDFIKVLKHQGIIIDTEENETQEVIKKIKEIRNTKVLSVVFSVTYRCNFQCVYCFERGVNIIKMDMDEEVLSEALLWCEKMIKKLNLRSISVVPFGGEPLLNSRAIQKILNFFNTRFSYPEYFVKYYMSTNGSLLSPKKVDFLMQNGLKHFQVTLDGLPPTHNKRRSGGKNSFALIWRNILNVIEKGACVELLFVADGENIKDFVPLIEFLNKKSRKYPLIKENIRLQASLVEPVEACMERAKRYLLGMEKEIVSEIVKGLKYAKNLGFKIHIPYYSNVCLRQLYYGFLIDPKGNIYKCYGAGGVEKYRIGDINTPINEILKRAREWADMDVWDEECINCELFPLCRGSFCQHHGAQFFNGEYGHKFCMKEVDLFYIKEALKANLYQE